MMHFSTRTALESEVPMRKPVRHLVRAQPKSRGTRAAREP